LILLVAGYNRGAPTLQEKRELPLLPETFLVKKREKEKVYQEGRRKNTRSRPRSREGKEGWTEKKKET